VDFVAISLLMVGFIVLCLVLLARAYPGSGADLVDWKPTRSHEVEAQLEIDDVQQMIEAQNEYRRRRGEAELTEEDAQQMAREDEAIRERARRAHDRRLAGQGIRGRGERGAGADRRLRVPGARARARAPRRRLGGPRHDSARGRGHGDLGVRDRGRRR
jgi:hypothetical protein